MMLYKSNERKRITSKRFYQIGEWHGEMKFNFWRPIFLILIAILTNNMVTNLCMLLGMAKEPASNVGFLAMIIAAILVYVRFTKNRKR